MACKCGSTDHEKGVFPDCGCGYTTDDDGVHFCKLHAAAPQLLVELKRLHQFADHKRRALYYPQGCRTCKLLGEIGGLNG